MGGPRKLAEAVTTDGQAAVALLSDGTYRVLDGDGRGREEGPTLKAVREALGKGLFPRPASPRPTADDHRQEPRRGGASGGGRSVGPIGVTPGPVFNSPNKPRAGRLINSGGRGSSSKVLT